ncbi:chemotaxis-specific protein-glutamate methyltransferase CheB [Urbifossiella limnaea]|uniref:Protein-glutamate methylesterase/protein-glutamine glutaminase n=1 Tax=Urbifossiella limnaea TaxID=2528023 RepID=A0A517XWT7_9BACT|nr:chemotaxis-specific protein-glutamate methyltransferase CheB [Urbifossiella limnaea]QDU21972.1 Chemotaxis response regulator protein-glutamate methylesterase [Urbifossiella limnaea]
MPAIRVLIVDDSAVFRRAVAGELSADPTLEVVGTAANGRIALAKLAQVVPDLVVLDVEMPELDGLATLREIRKTYPKLPVIMFSAVTERGAAATLDALALGATDYFPKPAGGGLDASLRVIREELIPEIKALCTRPAALPPTPHVGPVPVSGRVDVVAVAASTGGPNALADLFAGLPVDFPVPVVIAQHMPPMFTRQLAERLSARFAVRVEEGRAGAALAPGHAWIAPGDYHLVLARDAAGVRVVLNQEPPENSCRPAADVMFRSVAKAYGPAALGVVLTGMGQDGLRGSEAIRAAGGRVIVQDEATSVVWGMPGAVARAGLADRVLPLAQLAPEVVRRVRVGREGGR